MSMTEETLFYEAFKRNVLAFLRKYKKFVEEHEREPNKIEFEALIEEWLKGEVD